MDVQEDGSFSRRLPTRWNPIWVSVNGGDSGLWWRETCVERPLTENIEVTLPRGAGLRGRRRETYGDRPMWVYLAECRSDAVVPITRTLHLVESGFTQYVVPGRYRMLLCGTGEDLRVGDAVLGRAPGEAVELGLHAVEERRFHHAPDDCEIRWIRNTGWTAADSSSIDAEWLWRKRHDLPYLVVREGKRVEGKLVVPGVVPNQGHFFVTEVDGTRCAVVPNGEGVDPFGALRPGVRIEGRFKDWPKESLFWRENFVVFFNDRVLARARIDRTTGRFRSPPLPRGAVLRLDYWLNEGYDNDAVRIPGEHKVEAGSKLLLELPALLRWEEED